LLARLRHAEDEGAETARIEDARPREDVRITGAGNLRQLPDLSRTVERAARRLVLSRDDLREGRLPRSVAADEAHLVPAVDAERDALHESACRNTHLEIVHAEHRRSPFHSLPVDNTMRWGERLVFVHDLSQPGHRPPDTGRPSLRS